MALPADGRIVTAAGLPSGPFGPGARLVLRRFTAGGRPDTTFPTRVVRTRMEAMDRTGIAVDRHGRIVVAAGGLTPLGGGALLARVLGRAPGR